MSIGERVRRATRYIYLRVLRLKASSHSIALGLAIGVFIGLLPIVPLQTVVVLGLAFLLRCNKFASVCGTWVSNPFDLVFIYYLLFKVGEIFVPFEGMEFNAESLVKLEMFDMGLNIFITMTVGGLILGIPSSIATYFLSRKFIEEYRRRKAVRMLRKRTGTA